jgi:hypothetical protein
MPRSDSSGGFHHAGAPFRFWIWICQKAAVFTGKIWKNADKLGDLRKMWWAGKVHHYSTFGPSLSVLVTRDIKWWIGWWFGTFIIFPYIGNNTLI